MINVFQQIFPGEILFLIVITNFYIINLIIIMIAEVIHFTQF